MGWARKFSSETPLKKLNWSTTIGFSFKTLCIWPAQNPEKSRDFIFKNPGIFINLKSRDPGIPGIPLRPGGHPCSRQKWVTDMLSFSYSWASFMNPSPGKFSITCRAANCLIKRRRELELLLLLLWLFKWLGLFSWTPFQFNVRLYAELC